MDQPSRGFRYAIAALVATALALTLAPAAGADTGALTASIAVGDQHSCGVRTDATIACWGRDVEHQSSPPAGAFTAVSAGPYANNACGLRTDGTLACWGSDDQGQSSPPSGTFTAVAAGHRHGCAIRTNGTLECWGSDSSGQASPPAGTFKAVATGWLHSCAIRTDGTVACWGATADGQSSPPGGTFTTVSAGAWHSCGLRADGTLACWGSDDDDQSSPPAGTFAAVVAGGSHNCALRTDATVTCWGRNIDDQATPPVGRFTALAANTRHTCGVRIDGTAACWGLTGWGQTSPPGGTFARRAVEAGFEHSCGVRANGSASCWGRDGVGATSTPEGAFAAVSAGDSTSCGLRAEGSLACWGADGEGQASPPAGTFTAVSAGGLHGCAVQAGGTVDCWGADGVGQSSPPAGSFAAVSAGYAHSCALAHDGTLDCWGSQAFGQSSPPAGTFTAVSAGSGFACAVATGGTLDCWGTDGTSSPPAGTYTAVAAGGLHACALATDGTLDCWGANGSGQSSPPAGTYVAVSSGAFHSCAVRADGWLACWGQAADQRLGAPIATVSDAPPAAVFARTPYSHDFIAGGAPAASFAVTAGNLPPGLTLSPSGRLSGTPTTAGTYTFTVTASNGLFAPDASAAFSIAVTDDATAPQITPSVDGTLGRNGWHRGDVDVSWTVTEPDSPATLETTGCDDAIVSADTTGTTFTCQAESAGGTISESVTIKRDATAPTVAIDTPAAGPYVHNQAVAAEYRCQDGGSGVDACEAPVASGANIDTATPGDKTFAVTATDAAGNTSGEAVRYTVAARAAEAAPPAQPAPAAGLRVKVRRLAIFGRAGTTARCVGASRPCQVSLRAGRRVVAKGRAPGATVRLTLTRFGKRLLARRLGGVRVRVHARSGDQLAAARARAIPRVERFATPPGSFQPGRAGLSRRGRSFVRNVRARLIAVAAIRCDGYSADAPGSLSAVRFSRARAATLCGALRVKARTRVVGRGDVGRGAGGRVKVTVVHR